MNSTKRTKAVEIALAFWPNNTEAHRKIGDADYPICSDCDSLWLSLRVVDDDSQEAWNMSGVVSDVGIYVWLAASHSTHITVNAHEVHSADERKLHALHAFVSRMNRKLAKVNVGGFSKLPFESQITSALAAMGIKQAICYSGQIGPAPTLQPVTVALPAIFEDYNRRLARAQAYKQRKAA